MTKRMRPSERKQDLLAAGLKLAERHGYMNLTRDKVCEVAQVSGPVLNHYFQTMADYKRELLDFAVRVKCLRVIAHGIVTGELRLDKDDPLREQALRALC